MHVTVLPMDGDRVLEDHTVVVRDGEIVAVGPTDSTPVPDGAERIVARGRFLMPGLAEMHAHVPPTPERPPEQALDDLLFLYVANGVTTIRGMLGSAYQIGLRDELRADARLGPAFYAAAPSVNGNSAQTPEAAGALIRSAAAAGYDLQKIHPGVSREAWDRMVEIAGEVGITYGGHVPSDVGIEHALASGISTVDHMDGYLEASGTPAAGYDDARMRELARRTAQAGAYVVPTHYLWQNLYGARTAEEALQDPEMRYVSPQQRQAWRNQAGGLNPLGAEQLGTFVDARDRMLRYLEEAGVPLLMGTDSPQLFNVPGFALHREIRAMADAGLSNRTILESGTCNVGRYVAEVLGSDDVFGQVAPGHRADLVLLDGNPLDDLAHLDERAGVMVRGRWLPHERIEEGLRAIAERHAAAS
jgi:imidazolonepropionase-like amidohydrolase